MASDLIVFDVGGTIGAISAHERWNAATSSARLSIWSSVSTRGRRSRTGTSLYRTAHISPSYQMYGRPRGRQRIGEEVLVPAPLQELVATVETVVVLGEQEERSVVGHLGDGRRAVVERELVHTVRRHHGAELGHPHEAPAIAVVVPRRVEGGSVASLGCVHGIAHHARIAHANCSGELSG